MPYEAAGTVIIHGAPVRSARDKFRWLALRRFGTFGSPHEKLPPSAHRTCVDMRSTQLFHPLPCVPRNVLTGASDPPACDGGLGGGCPWPRDRTGQARAYRSLTELPTCVLGGADTRGAASRRAAPAGELCLSITRRQRFAGESDFWPNASGVWPLRAERSCSDTWGNEACESRGMRAGRA